MFDQILLAEQRSATRPFAWMLSLTLQLVCVFAAVVASLAYTPLLPIQQLRLVLLPPRLPEPVQTAQEKSSRVSQTSARPVQLHLDTVRAQVVPHAPTTLRVDVPDLNTGPFASGTAGLSDQLLGSPAAAMQPGPPASSSKTQRPTTPVSQSSGVAAANLLTKVIPVYPPLAKAAGVQGTVEFSAIIGKDGRIQNLQLIRGHPLLIRAAREAVVLWRYRPTLLNGTSVDVATTITVNFTMTR